MKIIKWLLFIPVIGFGYAVLMTFLEHEKADERIKSIAIFYHLFFIALTGIIGQHLHPF